MASIAQEDAQPQVLFRPGKKRKVYRQRSEDADIPSDGVEQPTPPPRSVLEPASASESHDPRKVDDDEEEGLPVMEVIRRRNARKARLGGVVFRTEQTQRTGETDTDNASNIDQSLTSQDGSGNSSDKIVGGIAKRFASQTGLVGELVNKHMEEYVESELARRQRHARERAEAAEAQAQAQDLQPHGAAALDDQLMAPQPAKQGKLFEIDLGAESRARTAEMTELARRRLQGNAVGESGEADSSSVAAPGSKGSRLGRDGKPLRTRERRNSEDIKRDQLVEEFLRENKLEIYDLGSEQNADPEFADEGEGAADDKIAEKFRREFMEAMAQRRKRKKVINKPKAAPKVQEEILRGPKLGGSRNVRAAMRDILLKQQEEKKKQQPFKR
ncbi:hypothetical protein VTK73DRAFT_6685 [Phialemonium thermophilum]|uniref:Uncharacterized protein n=1 Tax=Phialemonium thermophilum TaxID=223376 RepID=A0ABR3WJ44_9PEZI